MSCSVCSVARCEVVETSAAEAVISSIAVATESSELY
ncbi:Uncharacterised protein [Vibrio cholerae]|nr:Uncharacterised protein [Vibrio cholerae]